MQLESTSVWIRSREMLLACVKRKKPSAWEAPGLLIQTAQNYVSTIRTHTNGDTWVCVMRKKRLETNTEHLTAVKFLRFSPILCVTGHLSNFLPWICICLRGGCHRGVRICPWGVNQGEMPGKHGTRTVSHLTLPTKLGGGGGEQLWKRESERRCQPRTRSNG